MLLTTLLATCFVSASGLKIPLLKVSYNEPALACVVNITRQYLAANKNMAYINLDCDFDILQKKLHSLEVISFNRAGRAEVTKTNSAYMLAVTSVPTFLEHNLLFYTSEANWNPYARFLIIIKLLTAEELRQVFDIFLRHRVSNVVVMNGTPTAELYSYNPYENFACGRYYTRIIEYGKCSNVTENIYPRKTITGLRNCFFNVSVAHWPPWTIDPSKVDDPSVIGAEQLIFNLMAKVEQFKYKFQFDYDPEDFSTVSRNLSISGPLTRLAENRTDVMIGGLMLLPSRASYFAYVSGYVDYMDEIRLVVRKARVVPAWKDIFVDFSATLWALLFLTLIIYSALVAILLKTKDRGRVVLVLLDGLLSHGSAIRCRPSVKRVVIIWVIFAYLVNSYYTTTLMSLTTKPSSNYQINTEKAVVEQRLEPCISSLMGIYMKSEHNHGAILKDVQIGSKGCEKLIESVKTVSKSDRMFSVILYSIYYVTRQEFCDEFGVSSIHSFRKPYTKVIYAMYLNKGFPMKWRLRTLALRIREVGLSIKNIKDQFYNETLKHRYRSKRFKARFAIPWYLYSAGILVSTLAFLVELACQYIKQTSHLLVRNIRESLRNR